MQRTGQELKTSETYKHNGKRINTTKTPLISFSITIGALCKEISDIDNTVNQYRNGRDKVDNNDNLVKFCRIEKKNFR